MRIIYNIAINTYKEIIRDRILYGLLVFATLLIGLSMAVGQLSYAEQVKISIDFGMAGIHISSIMLAIFVGSSLVSKEIEKKTILTLFARPISRFQFVAGKFIGLEIVLSITILGLALVLLVILYNLGESISWLYVAVVFGIFLEASVLLAVALFLGSIVSPMVVVSSTIGIFLTGHWVESLLFFSQQSKSVIFQKMGYILVKAMPNFERVNWRSVLSYKEVLPMEVFIQGTGYMVSWACALVVLTAIVFHRREFV